MVVDEQTPVALRAFDGSSYSPPDPVGTVVFRHPRALRYMLGSPGELGIARAYVTGDLDIEGDLHATLTALDEHRREGIRPRDFIRYAERWMLRPAPIPAEEAPASWRRGLAPHTRRRDAQAIEHHYDLPSSFYELLLGPTMTYSCAVFSDPTTSLEDAQIEKVDLICRKLDLKPGERLLDVGAGWGTLVRHAARNYGVQALGVTLSAEQARHASAAIAADGLADRAEVRKLDYRDLDLASYDAISSVGAMEHFGVAHLGSHFAAMRERLRPEGRMLNHAIMRPDSHVSHRPGPFIDRYVFPDGELQAPGAVIAAMNDNGLELRHEENLREHYGLTLREWGRNLERHWDSAVDLVGERRARVWRLYMAMSRIGFETGLIEIHQLLAVNCGARGQSGMPLRLDFSRRGQRTAQSGQETGRPARRRAPSLAD
jgi:cyclopropane-fatty-acyl-phospholipid synthase